MRLLRLRFAIVAPMIAWGLLAGCSTETVPACADVSWVGGLNQARLAGPPSYSAAQIAPGEPLTISVPVDANTRRVRVGIRSVDEPPPGLTVVGEETDGGEVVEMRLEDTNLPAGVYVAGEIDLSGDIEPQFALYAADDPSTPYVLSVFPAAELQRSCVTDIFAPTFTVVIEGANGPER